MALTLGSGPFGHKPAAQMNSTIEGPRHVLLFEDYPRALVLTPSRWHSVGMRIWSHSMWFSTA